MSHLIIAPYDQVLSIEGTEWHDLAKPVKVIDRKETKILEFPLLESIKTNFVLSDGTVFDGGGAKGVFADLRGRGQGIVQLSTMGDEYSMIENSEILDMTDRAFTDVGVKWKISSAGTLDACKKFFLSVQLEGFEDLTCGGDRFLSFLNFVTSHDGTIACTAYDSMIRIVCMNTLRWSMDAAGAVGFKVKHTKNAKAQMENLELFLNELLNGRDVFKQEIDALANIACDVEKAENFTKGYLAKVNKVKGGMELSTRSKNAAVEVLNLFMAGEGNEGETMNDLVNGGTEYWTHGSGTGKKASQVAKVSASSFGMAADHKSQWFDALRKRETRESLIALGKTFKSAYA